MNRTSALLTAGIIAIVVSACGGGGGGGSSAPVPTVAASISPVPSPSPAASASVAPATLAITSVPLPATFGHVGDIAIGPDGAVYFLAAYNQLVRATANSSTILCTFPNPPVSFSGIDLDHAAVIAIRADGTVYSVASPQQLVSCSPAGVVRVVPDDRTNDYLGNAIALDGNGYPVTVNGPSVITYSNAAFQRSPAFGVPSLSESSAADGSIWSIDGRTFDHIVSGAIAARFPAPAGFGFADSTVGADGKVWFAGSTDTVFPTPIVGSLTPDGTFSIVTAPASFGGGFSAITAGPKPNTFLLLNANVSTNVLAVFTPPGNFVSYALPKNAVIKNLRTAPDGKVWFTMLGSSGVASLFYFTLP